MFEISLDKKDPKSNGNAKSHIYMSIAFVSILRSRADANERCNESLTNEDRLFRIRVINEIGCIPVYWNRLNGEDVDVGLCKSLQQLKMAHRLILKPTEILSTYDPPCVQMQVPVNINQKLLKGEIGEFRISISYLAEKYQEINNIKDFDLGTLWCNAGGYIGMFCGFSLLQLADTLDNNWHRYWVAFRHAFLRTICSVIMCLPHVASMCK